MLFPKFLYGLYRDVKKRCTKLVKATTSLDGYGACVLSMGMVDTAQSPGLFALSGPSSLLGGRMTYQVFLPFGILNVPTRDKPELRAALFQEHLKTAWGTLLLTANPNCIFWFHEGNRMAYLEAVFTHWDELSAVGPRYTDGSDEGLELLQETTMIQHTLCHVHGLSNEQARRISLPDLFHDMRAKWALGQRATCSLPRPEGEREGRGG